MSPRLVTTRTDIVRGGDDGGGGGDAVVVED